MTAPRPPAATTADTVDTVDTVDTEATMPAARAGVARQRLSCIIPTYNDASRIASVLDSVLAQPLIDEVIVVDDGSDDDSGQIVSRYVSIRLIRLPQNRGKTCALATGLRAAAGPYVLLLDADLAGLQPADLAALACPVLEQHADISISLRRNAPKLWHLIGIDYISGERVFRKSLIESQLGELTSLPRFGFEVWLNRLCVIRSTRIAIVRWDAVDSPYKTRKFGWFRGAFGECRMILEMFQTVSPPALVMQIIAMRRLRVTSRGGDCSQP